MAVSGSTLHAPRIASAPRWQALVLAATLVGASWAAGFATGRVMTPDLVRVTVHDATVEPVPVSIRPGRDRGQVKVGPDSVEVAWTVRPGNHGGGDVKGG